MVAHTQSDGTVMSFFKTIVGKHSFIIVVSAGQWVSIFNHTRSYVNLSNESFVFICKIDECLSDVNIFISFFLVQWQQD